MFYTMISSGLSRRHGSLLFSSPGWLYLAVMSSIFMLGVELVAFLLLAQMVFSI